MYRRSLGHQVSDDAALNALLLATWGSPQRLQLPAQEEGLRVRGGGSSGGGDVGEVGDVDAYAAGTGTVGAIRGRKQVRNGSKSQKSVLWGENSAADGDTGNDARNMGRDAEEEEGYEGEDTVEVYGEDGTLVGVYSLQEFEYFRNKGENLPGSGQH